MAEMNLFNLDWQKRIEEFNLEIEHLLDELRIKHQKQLVLYCRFSMISKTKQIVKRSFTKARNYWNSEKLNRN